LQVGASELRHKQQLIVQREIVANPGIIQGLGVTNMKNDEEMTLNWEIGYRKI
jgi:hypothetical protein